jgi:hypothetical protein
MNAIIGFVRRENPDSTIDSICTKCFQTIAVARCERDLIRAENDHTCEPLYERQRSYPNFLRKNA